MITYLHEWHHCYVQFDELLIFPLSQLQLPSALGVDTGALLLRQHLQCHHPPPQHQTYPLMMRLKEACEGIDKCTRRGFQYYELKGSTSIISQYRRSSGFSRIFHPHPLWSKDPPLRQRKRGKIPIVAIIDENQWDYDKTNPNEATDDYITILIQLETSELEFMLGDITCTLKTRWRENNITGRLPRRV